MADVDRSRQLLLIRDTKFDKDRLVPCGPRVGVMLERYLAARHARDLAADAPLFAGRVGKRLGRQQIGRVFRGLLPALGLTVPRGYLAAAPPQPPPQLCRADAAAVVPHWRRSRAAPASPCRPFRGTCSRSPPRSISRSRATCSARLASVSKPSRVRSSRSCADEPPHARTGRLRVSRRPSPGSQGLRPSSIASYRDGLRLFLQRTGGTVALRAPSDAGSGLSSMQPFRSGTP